jgi:hypothetical protein
MSHADTTRRTGGEIDVALVVQLRGGGLDHINEARGRRRASGRP